MLDRPVAAEDQDQQAAAERLTAARALLASDKPELKTFFDALFAAAAPDDLLRSTPDTLAALARTVFAAALAHQPGAIDVQLAPGPDPSLPEQLLIAVNDDRPFLYDSAVLAAVAGGARIRAAFHPIVTLAARGGLLSVIVLVMDAMANEP